MALQDQQTGSTWVNDQPAPWYVRQQMDMLDTQATGYVSAYSTTLFTRPDSIKAIAELKRGDKFHRLERKGRWALIKTVAGDKGYVPYDHLSNTWVMVSKSRARVLMYSDSTLLTWFPADFAINIAGDKVQRGSTRNPEDWRTPEGIFYISRLNPNSQFHKALIINYPAPRHAEQGYKDGIISKAQYLRLLKAEMMVANPPMNTRLGGLIEFHGDGLDGRGNWTQGCIALENQDIDVMYDMVGVGTPVIIHPYKARLMSDDIRPLRPMLVRDRLPAKPTEVIRKVTR